MTVIGHPTSLAAPEALEAKFINLRVAPRTPLAKALVSDAQAAVEAWEGATAIRLRGRRDADRERLAIAIGAIIAAAALSIDEGMMGRIYRSLSKATWPSDEVVGYDTMRAALAGLCGVGILEVLKPGYFRRNAFGGASGRGKATRYHSSHKFREMLAASALRPGESRSHFAILPPKNPIELRGEPTRATNGTRLPGPTLPIPSSRIAERIREQVNEINEFIARHHIQGANHDGLSQGFQ